MLNHTAKKKKKTRKYEKWKLTIAAAVSSQLVSMPKTTISPSRFGVRLWTEEKLRVECLWGRWIRRRDVKSEVLGKKFTREIVGIAIVERKSSIVLCWRRKKENEWVSALDKSHQIIISWEKVGQNRFYFKLKYAIRNFG